MRHTSRRVLWRMYFSGFYTSVALYIAVSMIKGSYFFVERGWPKWVTVFLFTCVFVTAIMQAIEGIDGIFKLDQELERMKDND